MKNRKKTAGLLVVAMGLSLALTGCGETTVQVEGLPQEFHAYEDSGDVNSTVTIDNVDYTIEDDPYLKKQQDITVTVSGSYTYDNTAQLPNEQKYDIIEIWKDK